MIPAVHFHLNEHVLSICTLYCMSDGHSIAGASYDNQCWQVVSEMVINIISINIYYFQLNKNRYGFNCDVKL